MEPITRGQIARGRDSFGWCPRGVLIVEAIRAKLPRIEDIQRDTAVVGEHVIINVKNGISQLLPVSFSTRSKWCFPRSAVE